MFDSKLILIEGLPGSGKTTTTEHLGSVLQNQGIECQYFREDADPHPIACLEYKIKGLTPKMVSLWKTFVMQALNEPGVTIIESRLWQNTALFMVMSEVAIDEIIQFNQQVWEALTPLSPALIYLDQDNTEQALRRVYTTRGEEWIERALNSTTSYAWFTSRGLHDFAGWVEFFEEWQPIAERLYRDWPGHKVKILNPHQDWEKAYQQMAAFLQINFAMPVITCLSHKSL